MKKVAMFVFNGSPMCFVHVLLNALDMHARGDDVHIVMEGRGHRARAGAGPSGKLVARAVAKGP